MRERANEGNGKNVFVGFVCERNLSRGLKALAERNLTNVSVEIRQAIRAHLERFSPNWRQELLGDEDEEMCFGSQT